MLNVFRPTIRCFGRRLVGVFKAALKMHNPECIKERGLLEGINTLL